MKQFIVLLGGNYTRDMQIFHGTYNHTSDDEDISMSDLWRDSCNDIVLGVYAAETANEAQKIAAQEHDVDYGATYAFEILNNVGV